MVEKVPSPRHILQRNLQALLRKNQLKGPELARRTGVDRKTVYNYLHGLTDPRPDHVRTIAKLFHLDASMLLSEAFRPEMANDANLKQLLEHYEMANEDGRDLILRVAEAAPRKTG